MRKALGWRTIAIITTALTAVPAYAQEAVPAAPTEATDSEQQSAQQQQDAQRANSGTDIVVTARRREERLQDVPIAVTAITPDSLERQNIVDVSQLSTQAPSLTITPGAGAGKSTPTFGIRGQSQQELTILADPSVSLYIGDVVAPRSQGANGAMFDLASVQVLKGPQGTLFGRNSTGGIVQLIPNTPSSDFEGSVAVTVGNLGTLNTQAVVNVPLTDTLAARVAIATNRDDGYLYDALRQENVNHTDNQAMRFSVRWNPGNFTNTTIVDVYHANEGGTGGFIQFVNPNGVFNSPAARAARNYPTLQEMLAEQQQRGQFETASGTPTFTKIDTVTAANTSELKLSDSITAKNIFGYRHVKSHTYEDTDGLPIPLLEIERIFDQEQYSNEFQILGDTGALNWIAGAYYFRETGSDQGASVTGAVNPGPLKPASIFAYPAWANTFVTARNTSWAIFAQGTLQLLDGLSVTAGVRQNWDERTAVVRNRTQNACRFTVDTDGNPATPEVNPGLAGCALPLSTNYSEPTYNVSLDYKFAPNKLIYVAHRRGYRTGGFGARAATEAGLRRTFEPETVNDIELGVKADWNFGSEAFLRTNLAVYTSDYRNIQRLLQDNTVIPVTTVTANAQKARIRGAEFEFLFRPIREFEFSGFWSHTDAKFIEFIDPNGVDLSATRFARAPKNVYSFTGRVMPQVSPELADEASMGFTFFHTDGFVNNDSAAATQFNEAYSLVNFNADLRNVAGTRASVGIFVNNLLNEKYSFGLLDVFSSLGFSSKTPGEPRTYGMRLKYDF
jgi:iron complex outermembrane receptor protein